MMKQQKKNVTIGNNQHNNIHSVLRYAMECNRSQLFILGHPRLCEAARRYASPSYVSLGPSQHCIAMQRLQGQGI